jgi:hypothetical protein
MTPITVPEPYPSPRNASEAESARVTGLGRRLNVHAQTNRLGLFNDWPCRISAAGQLQIPTSSNNNSLMPSGSPLASANKHNLRQARPRLLRSQKIALTPIFQPYFTGLFSVGFAGFGTQAQPPQQPGFGTTQPQNTFGGEAHTLGVLIEIYYSDTIDY